MALPNGFTSYARCYSFFIFHLFHILLKSEKKHLEEKLGVRILTDMVLTVMLSSEMYLNLNLVLQVTLLKKRRIDAKLIQTNNLESEDDASLPQASTPGGFAHCPFLISQHFALWSRQQLHRN